MLGFVGHKVFCCSYSPPGCSRRTPVSDLETNRRGHVLIKLSVQNPVVGWIASAGCLVCRSLLRAYKKSVPHFICQLNWIKISLESVFLSFIIISQAEESYQPRLEQADPKAVARDNEVSTKQNKLSYAASCLQLGREKQHC